MAINNQLALPQNPSAITDQGIQNTSFYKAFQGIQSAVTQLQTGLAVADVTGSRAGSTVYQNTTGSTLFVSGYTITGGSSTGTNTCLIGPDNPPTLAVAMWEYTATTAGGSGTFQFIVPNDYYYELVPSGEAASGGLGKWYEYSI